MNDEELSTQLSQLNNFRSTAIEFDPDLKVDFDDELDLAPNPELSVSKATL